jgi:tetratricopeptide (TPR) repeat protein/TolB-like protein
VEKNPALFPAESPDSTRLEIAHVLFTDIVGYSRLPMDEQRRLLHELQDIVRNTTEFQHATSRDQLITLPTGDGMALVFFGSPEDSVQCAVEIGRELRRRPSVPLRMGLHSGPVYRVPDINANRNVAGGGINLAQRVMDCGDAGHILLSDATAKTLEQLSTWGARVHDLGEIKVKHGLKIRVYSLYSDEVGNAATPASFRRASRRLNRAYAAAVLAALLILSVATGIPFGPVRWISRRPNPPAESTSVPTRKSLAVLGFRNLTGRADSNWLSGALAQCLNTELAAGERMRIISGETVARMKLELSVPDTDSLSAETLARVHHSISADMVVLGSFITIGAAGSGQIRLDLRIQDAVLGETIVSVSDVGTEASLLELIARVGTTVRSRLGLESRTAPEAAALRASLPQDPAAQKLYIDGLNQLRMFDALGARDSLTKAAAIDPRFAPVHSALAEAWAVLGYDARATIAAKKAFELSAPLSREQRLWIEGVYRRYAGDMKLAATVFDTLFGFFPDNVEYGLRLEETLLSTGDSAGAFAVLTRLRSLPFPLSNDPRIDLAESEATAGLADFARSLASARAAIATAEKQGASLLVARSRINEAWALFQLGKPVESSAANREALAIFKAAGDQRGVSRALIQLGAVSRKRGDLKEAEALLGEALQIARNIGSRRNAGRALNNLGSISYDRGDMPRARDLYAEAVAVNRDIGDLPGLAQALDNLAAVSYELGDSKTARPLGREALELRRQIGNKLAIAGSLLNMSEAESEYGSNAEARPLAEEALALNRALGNKQEEAYSLVMLAQIVFRQGNVPEAERLEREALKLRESLIDADGMRESRLALADVLIECGKFDEAESLARLVLKDGSRERRARALSSIAAGLLAQRNVTEADRHAREALSLATGADRRTRLMVEITAARAQAAGPQPAIALKALEHVTRDAHRFGLVFYQLESRLAASEVILQRLPDRRREALENLQAVEQDARRAGLSLIAEHAAAVANRNRT